MSTPTKKRRLPGWTVSAISTPSKEGTSQEPQKGSSQQRNSGIEDEDRNGGSCSISEVAEQRSRKAPSEEVRSSEGRFQDELRPCGNRDSGGHNGVVPPISKDAGGSSTKAPVRELKTPKRRCEEPQSGSSQRTFPYESQLPDRGDAGEDNARISPIRKEVEKSITKASVSKVETSQGISHQRSQDDMSHVPEAGDSEESNGRISSVTKEAENRISTPAVRDFSKLLEGVVLTISGLVNPERTEVRKMCLEMGAKYRPSWSNDSTLLAAAFINTPGFNVAKAAGGTIVHKDWVVECYKHKDLVAIEKYMLYVGKPWRKGSDVDESTHKCAENNTPRPTGNSSGMSQTDKEDDRPVIGHKGDTRIDKAGKEFSQATAGDRGKLPKNQGLHKLKDMASTEEIEQWVLEDLASTKTWLEQQNEKPERDQVEAIAVQGLLVCLEDAVKSLQENMGLSLVMENWAFIPRAVKELAGYEKQWGQGRHIRDQLITEGERFKLIYLKRLQKLGLGPSASANNGGSPVAESKRKRQSVQYKEDSETDDDATEIISDSDTQDEAELDTPNKGSRWNWRI